MASRRCLGCGILVNAGSRCTRCAAGQRGANPRDDPEFRHNRTIVYRRDTNTAGEPCCQMCGRTQAERRPGDQTRKDRELACHHRTPLSHGGTHQLGNLVLLCGRCHRLAHRFCSSAFRGPGGPRRAASA